MEPHNVRVWRRGRFVRSYSGWDLRPAEAALLARHPERFFGRTLELGPGGGRISGHLIDRAESFLGVDISPRMVEHARTRYPRGAFEVGDLRELGGFADGSFDLVFAGNNLVDVLGDAERRRVLAEIRRLLSPGGALVMSSHNRDAAPATAPRELPRNPIRLAYRLVGQVASARNRRRLDRFEREEETYAIRNDSAHWYRLVHYYISRDAQERQFADVGLTLLEVLDEDGRVVAPGERAPGSTELHYLAVKSAA